MAGCSAEEGVETEVAGAIGSSWRAPQLGYSGDYRMLIFIYCNNDHEIDRLFSRKRLIIDTLRCIGRW